MIKPTKKPSRTKRPPVSQCVCVCCRRHARESRVFESRWRQALKETSLTQKEVAKYLGVHPAQISQWMKAGSVPDQYKVGFATLVGKDLNWLTEYTSKNNSFNSRYREFQGNWRAFIRPGDVLTCELCEDKFEQSRNQQMHKISISRDPADVMFLCTSCLLKEHEENEEYH